MDTTYNKYWVWILHVCPEVAWIMKHFMLSVAGMTPGLYECEICMANTLLPKYKQFDLTYTWHRNLKPQSQSRYAWKHCFLKISKCKCSLLLNVEDYEISSPYLFPSEDLKCEQKFLVNNHFPLNCDESFQVDALFPLKYDQNFWVNAHFHLKWDKSSWMNVHFLRMCDESFWVNAHFPLVW